VVVAVAQDGEAFKKQLTSDEPSPMSYDSPKPDEILEEDKVVDKFPLELKPEDVTVVPANQVFE
jgi:zinc protease